MQETRLWDEIKLVTTTMRKKEGLADYRCGPDQRWPYSVSLTYLYYLYYCCCVGAAVLWRTTGALAACVITCTHTACSTAGAAPMAAFYGVRTACVWPTRRYTCCEGLVLREAAPNGLHCMCPAPMLRNATHVDFILPLLLQQH